MFHTVALLLFLLAPLSLPGSGPMQAQSLKDDDFAEFEDEDLEEFDFEVNEIDDEDFIEEGEDGEGEDDEFDDEGDFDDMDGSLEEDKESFELDMDEEEFEAAKIPAGKLDEIKLSDSAVRRGPVWKTYILEMVVVGGMVVYLLNYFFGRTKNSNMAHSWLKAHMDVLAFNFAIVGDNGEGEEPSEGELVKISDDAYSLWCSGRQNCAALLVYIQLCRRHDLIGVVQRLIQPKKDVITLMFQLGDEDEMDSFVLAIGTKKTLQKMQKEYEDLKNYTTTIRAISKADPLFYMSELPEATQAFLSDRNCTFLAKHSHVIESVHLTDQYTGYVQDTDDDTVVVRKPEKRIIINFYASSFDQEEPYLKFALQVLDQIKNFRLSRESREKALKNRTSVSSTLDKLQHTQRQEAAQQRREDKVRARKERNMLLSESDPERARKLEEKENRRAKKKMQPKIKTMKVS